MADSTEQPKGLWALPPLDVDHLAVVQNRDLNCLVCRRAQLIEDGKIAAGRIDELTASSALEPAS